MAPVKPPWGNMPTMPSWLYDTKMPSVAESMDFYNKVAANDAVTEAQAIKLKQAEREQALQDELFAAYGDANEVDLEKELPKISSMYFKYGQPENAYNLQASQNRGRSFTEAFNAASKLAKSGGQELATNFMRSRGYEIDPDLFKGMQTPDIEQGYGPQGKWEKDKTTGEVKIVEPATEKRDPIKIEKFINPVTLEEITIDINDPNDPKSGELLARIQKGEDFQLYRTLDSLQKQIYESQKIDRAKKEQTKTSTGGVSQIISNILTGIAETRSSTSGANSQKPILRRKPPGFKPTAVGR